MKVLKYFLKNSRLKMNTCSEFNQKEEILLFLIQKLSSKAKKFKLMEPKVLRPNYKTHF